MVIFVDIEDTADMTGHIGLVIVIWSYRLIDQFVFAMLKLTPAFRGSVVPWCSAFVCLFVCLWYICRCVYFCLGRFMSLGDTFMSICHAAGKYFC